MTHEPLLISDITTTPPPCMTKARALEIYTDPFKRAIEYTNLCHVDGIVAEFGTFHGFTARMFAELMQQQKDSREIWLYDSWEGFPSTSSNEVDANCKEVKDGFWKQGDCTPCIPDAEDRIKTVLNIIHPGKVKTFKGFYSDTFKNHFSLPTKISVLHIDCDLYQSTLDVLSTMEPRLADGAVILFDDFNNNLSSNQFGERRAFKETIADKCELWFTYGWSGYAYIYHKD